MTKPFAGIRILDFTRVLAGPFGTYQFALMGADVIKIESKDGDDMRYGGVAKEWSDRGMAPGWMAVNANKRSITLDLKKPEAIAVVKKLVETADIVWENFRGVMDSLASATSDQPEADRQRSRASAGPGRRRPSTAWRRRVRRCRPAFLRPARRGPPACDVAAAASAPRRSSAPARVAGRHLTRRCRPRHPIAEYTFATPQPQPSVTFHGDMFRRDGYIVPA